MARRFYVARKLEIGLNFIMIIIFSLSLFGSFFFILPQILEKVKFLCWSQLGYIACFIRSIFA